MRVEYQSNNSGGRWWLTDDDWRKLEAAGWTVEWAKEPDPGARFGGIGLRRDEDGAWRFLGALAKRAHRDVETPADAMRDFERVTGQDVSEEGCNCCGAPHCFSWEGGYASGEECLDHLFSKDRPRSLREAMEQRK